MGAWEAALPREQEQPPLPKRVVLMASPRETSGPPSRMPDEPAPPSRVELPPELRTMLPPLPPMGGEPPLPPLVTDELRPELDPPRAPAELENEPPPPTMPPVLLRIDEPAEPPKGMDPPELDRPATGLPAAPPKLVPPIAPPDREVPPKDPP